MDATAADATVTGELVEITSARDGIVATVRTATRTRCLRVTFPCDAAPDEDAFTARQDVFDVGLGLLPGPTVTLRGIPLDGHPGTPGQ